MCMPKFMIEEDFWSLFPQAIIGIVICRGIDNSIREVEFYEKLLREAAQEAQQHLGMEEFSSNPVVDIYNSISLRYGLPCGGEDVDTFVGDVRLTQANGTEPFLPLGSDDNAPPYEGEIVYKDDAGAI